jgi:hypothetical protein
MIESQKLNPDVQIIAEQQQRKHTEYLGSMRKIPGLILWELNLETRELNPAQFKKDDIQISSLNPTSASSTLRLKVDKKEGCYYFQALNRKSALLKLIKRGLKYTGK